MAVSRWTSYNRANWASFLERDHFGDPARPLRERLEHEARRHGQVLPAGPVYLLTHLRYAGYCFNPISLYYCFDADGGLAAVMAEVNNTFGGSQNYWLSPSPPPVRHAGGGLRRPFVAEATKALYVSPFLSERGRYRFVLTPPGERAFVHVAFADDTGARVFDATLSLRQQPWTAAAIRRALWRYPLITMQVIAAIHWQAARLWWHGVPVVPRHHPQGLVQAAEQTATSTTCA
jgi:DUF1365 family protein